MNGARELLEIAAEYMGARNFNELAPEDVDRVDLDEIAGRWEAALGDYVRAAAHPR